MGLWRERYSVEDKGLSFVREAEDYQMLVTPEQVQSYERSDHAMLAKELFQQLKLTKKAVTQTEYCCVRDHMYSVIHFGTGVSANLLMSEFRKATFINGSYDILFWNHKTVKKNWSCWYHLNTSTLYMAQNIRREHTKPVNL